MTTINMKLIKTHQFSQTRCKLSYYNILCNYPFTGITGAGHDQKFRSIRIIGIKVVVYNKDNMYRILINVIITGQVLSGQVAGDK